MIRQLFGKCFWLGHDDPVRERKGKFYHFICPECRADLGKVLPKQKFKKRKAGNVVTFRKKKPHRTKNTKVKTSAERSKIHRFGSRG